MSALDRPVYVPFDIDEKGGRCVYPSDVLAALDDDQRGALAAIVFVETGDEALAVRIADALCGEQA